MKKTATIAALYVLIACCFPADYFAQESPLSKQDTSLISAIHAFHSRFGTGKIILKDRSIIKKVIVHEIYPYWIIYKKDGSLHDLLIEEIDKIEIGKNKQRVIVFDENNKTIIY
ncbi:MAG: hypothetical protein COA57_02850 [Flavobacteriales bacterium]|nr:hypothetical protein [Bacteroidales bacterium AH-315-I05]PCJ89055.1 MAG: hypothetical protein COA57_02850 [Flavobacteriales bacterium]